MKFPNWALPLIIIAFVAIRLFVASRFRKAERKKAGKGQPRSLPIWIRLFWLLLAIALLVLVVWKPRGAAPAPQAQSAEPAPGAAPAAQK